MLHSVPPRRLCSSTNPSSLARTAMAAAPPGGGGGDGDGGSANLPLFGIGAAGGIEGRSPIEGGDGYSSSDLYSSDDDEFMEPALSMEQRVRLAKQWVANPSNSHELTHGLGGVL